MTHVMRETHGSCHERDTWLMSRERHMAHVTRELSCSYLCSTMSVYLYIRIYAKHTSIQCMYIRIYVKHTYMICMYIRIYVKPYTHTMYVYPYIRHGIPTKESLYFCNSGDAGEEILDHIPLHEIQYNNIIFLLCNVLTLVKALMAVWYHAST